ncbi:MAG: ABC transporter permease subunit [Oscillospiraceae bacterium]|jgi:NitT/TauT family transport system permease protein|nr:ABC transporter permease subunit [Oscillospiraceae bacterium]
MRGKKIPKKLILPLCALFWLLVWQFASMRIGEEILLVSPLAAGARFIELIAAPVFWLTAGFSLTRIMGGFLIALAVGGGLAALAYRFGAVTHLLSPLFSAVKSVPVASYTILCLIFLNTGSLALMIAFLMTLPIVYETLLEGLRQTDKRLLEMAKIFRISRLCRLRYIYAAQILPYLTSVIGVGVGIAWKSGVAAEVIGLPRGAIGTRLYEAKITLDMRSLFAWTVAVMLLCYLLEKLIRLLVKRAARVLERG